MRKEYGLWGLFLLAVLFAVGMSLAETAAASANITGVNLAYQAPYFDPVNESNFDSRRYGLEIELAADNASDFNGLQIFIDTRRVYELDSVDTLRGSISLRMPETAASITLVARGGETKTWKFSPPLRRSGLAYQKLTNVEFVAKGSDLIQVPK